MSRAWEIKKAWGKEVVIANNEKYCGKLLCYEKAGAQSSGHFHLKKHETFYVMFGSFELSLWDSKGVPFVVGLYPGDVVELEPGKVHMLVAREDNSVIVEVSTPHSDDDVVRIVPGDSQK